MTAPYDKISDQKHTLGGEKKEKKNSDLSVRSHIERKRKEKKSRNRLKRVEDSVIVSKEHMWEGGWSDNRQSIHKGKEKERLPATEKKDEKHKSYDTYYNRKGKENKKKKKTPPKKPTCNYS